MEGEEGRVDSKPPVNDDAEVWARPENDFRGMFCNSALWGHQWAFIGAPSEMGLTYAGVVSRYCNAPSVWQGGSAPLEADSIVIRGLSEDSPEALEGSVLVTRVFSGGRVSRGFSIARLRAEGGCDVSMAIDIYGRGTVVKWPASLQEIVSIGNILEGRAKGVAKRFRVAEGPHDRGAQEDEYTEVYSVVYVYLWETQDK